MELSTGLNDDCRSYSLDEIAERLKIPPRVARVRANYADFELLEKLGILRADDIVNIVRLNMNAAKRRGHTQRESKYPMQDWYLDSLEPHIRALKKHPEHRDQMSTLQQRWGLAGQPQSTVAEIVERDDVSPPTVEWRESAGIMALHRRVLLSNSNIHDDVRVWAGLVFHLLGMKACDNKRQMARLLDCTEPWKLNHTIEVQNDGSRELLRDMIGVPDGVALTAEQIAADREVSPGVVQSRTSRLLKMCAEGRGVAPYSIDWLNKVSDAIYDQKSQSAQDVLDPEEFAALQLALDALQQDDKWGKAVTALKMRAGVEDGAVRPTSEIEPVTGITKKKFAKKMRDLLTVLEQVAAQL